MAKKKLLRNAENLAKSLELKKIHLWETKCSRDLSFKPKKAEISIEIQVTMLKSETEGLLPFACRFIVVATEKEREKKAFELEVVFCAVYRIKNNYKPTEEECNAFGSTSAVFNVWPYLREYVHDIIVKMDLPALVLSPITISQLAKMTSTDKPEQLIAC